MKSRTWFLLSVMLFIAAAFFWKLGEDRHTAQEIARQTSADTAKESSAKSANSATAITAKESLNNSATNSATNSAKTNAQVLYPHRLQNTSQTVGQLVRNDRAILLRNALIDTSAEGVRIPDALRSQGDPGSYIVQSRGVIDTSFRAVLLGANAEVISYVPNNAYLVRLPEGGAEKLAGNKSVQSVLRYEPYYKLDYELLTAVMENKEIKSQLRVTLFPGQLDSAIAALKGKATILAKDTQSSPFGPELILTQTDVVTLAHLHEVQGIEAVYPRQLANDLMRERTGISLDTVVTTNYLGLSGLNVWVNVNDTPIDNEHPDLESRIFPGAGTAIIDTDGHGTHVAGTIASSGVSGPVGDDLLLVGSLANANFRGAAPESKILSLDVFAGLTDAELQIAAASTNFIELERSSPLISNNSWGYGVPTYNSSAASFDAAVRDALPGTSGSQPIAYVFSIGNSGDGSDGGQSGFPGSVLSPSSAKNVITVGSLESYRNITNEIIRPNDFCLIVTNAEFLGMTDSSNEVAAFSSRGNVGISLEGDFGRMKPDVVAPGTFIASTRSQQFDEESYYSPLRVAANLFPGLVIDPRATNNFSIFVPDDPCDTGTALDVTISVQATDPAGAPLLLYVGTAAAVTNSITLDRGSLPLGGSLPYLVVNTNDFEVEYSLRTSITLSNDFGAPPNGYFQVLSNLNEILAPNYRFESGTSMAAPAISGMLALMQEFFEQRHAITNSPAMMKALLINGARAAGDYSYEKQRSLNLQGWGLPDLRQILPTNGTIAEWPIQLFDQGTNTALGTGQREDRALAITDTDSPLRVTLVWTDPPGNPAVGVKLVNDLDLIVTEVATDPFDGTVSTNIYFGNNFSGGEFTQPNGPDSTNQNDTVNNVENVYINGPIGSNITVSVVAKRVNVNAVTGHTNGIVQDYALVISSGNLTGTSPFTVTTNVIPADTNSFVTVVTNGMPLFGQRVGANSPLTQLKGNNLTDGTNSQWAFYVLENPNNFTNIAFLTFLPPNLSGTTNLVPGSRRNLEADIDLYVSTDSSLTNLNPGAIAGADKSLRRGGLESIVYTNRNDPVFYVGVKSEDQRAAEFAFFAVASEFPFSSDDGNGNLILRNLVPPAGIPIPDGSPDKPGGIPVLVFATEPINVARVVVTNQFTHERIGDLINTLTHEQNSAVLLNHSSPDGQEDGTFLGVYDDSGLIEGTGGVPVGRLTDGPGSLVDFVGEEGVGAWLLTLEDNALSATGRVEHFSVFLERSLETNALPDGGPGFAIPTVVIPGNSSRGLTFVVPLDATNMIVSIAPKEGPIDTVVRQGRQAPLRNPYVDHGKIINPPGDSLIVGLTNTPPLKPGRYTLRLFNDSGSPVTLSGVVRFELDLSASSFATLLGGFVPILDDAVVNSVIHVDRGDRVVNAEVGVRIDHPRVSDLVLHLVSPEGTRILLAENRGGVSTNGYGVSALTTNSFPALSEGDNNPQTNSYPTGGNSGFVKIDYEFFDAPDQIQVFYDGLVIYDSGMVSGSSSITIPFGPGLDTEIEVVVNGLGNANLTTLWNYTATVYSGEVVYATFSNDTNLAEVPIKFAVPPFATNFLGSNIVSLMSSDFETEAPGPKTTTVDGWTVVTNTVSVGNAPNVAYSGSNYLNLGGGTVTRLLPTTTNKLYNLQFAYKRSPDSAVGGARIGIGGIFSNDFIGTANWITYSQTFGGSGGGTPLTLEGIMPDMLFDGFHLTEGGDPNFYQPEEALDTLIGENAQGDWKLEVWDNRVGQPVGGAAVVNWKLNLTFSSTNASAVVVTNGTDVTNIVNGAEIKYFIIDVPLNASHATNTLVSLGGPLNLLFNQTALPVGNPRFGDYTLLSVTTGGSYDLNTLVGPPYLQPGRRYYLGVQNVINSQTNQFTLRVDFDNTNNLVDVTPLTNGVPVSTNLPVNHSIHYYQYDLSNSVTAIRFELYGLNGDADLVVKRNLLPTPSSYDYNSNLGSTNDEIIVVSDPVPGRYYIGVHGFFPTNGIDYIIKVTEDNSPPEAPVLFNPKITPAGFQATATTIIGSTYEFSASSDFVTWTVLQTVTATANLTVFTDTRPPDGLPRVYRLRLLP